jgi:hypothetical protein
MTQDPNDLESALRETKAELARLKESYASEKRAAQEKVTRWGLRVSELEQALRQVRAETREECVSACGLCDGLGYDGMGGEEYDCAACAPIRALAGHAAKPHKKTWSCINPCGDGCDGNHIDSGKESKP